MVPALALVAIVAAAAWALSSSQESSSVPPLPSTPAPAPRVALVMGREHARNVHPRLLELLDAWDASGTHRVLIPGPAQLGRLGFPPAGLRSSAADAAAQAATAAQGGSSASTLAQTPHGPRLFEGRAVGWALDVWPEGFNPQIAWELQPAEMQRRFLVFADFARARGLVAGAYWRSATFPHGDQPHLEVPGWKSAPLALGVA